MLSTPFYFDADQWISMKAMACRFRVRDNVIEAWMFEGLIPQCTWRKGRRYWNSDEINALIAGCPVTFPVNATSSIKRFSRRSIAMNLLASMITFVAPLLGR